MFRLRVAGDAGCWGRDILDIREVGNRGSW